MKAWLYRLILFLLILFATNSSHAQIITTIAGNVSAGYSGNDGQATDAELNGPFGFAMDAAGNIFFSDQLNNVIRKISPSGVISLVAGTSTPGFGGDGGPATDAMFNRPCGLAIDKKGNIIIADTYNDVIRKIDTFGYISTIGGKPIGAGYWGINIPAVDAAFNKPTGIAIDDTGTIFISDYWNHVVRRIDTSGLVFTVAGAGYGASTGPGSFLGDGAEALAAGLDNPSGIAIDKSGNMYIADQKNNRIRKVDTAHIITTIAGGGSNLPGDDGPATDAILNRPTGISLDAAGNLYIADQNNYCIRKVNTAGIISRVAGNYINGFSGDGGKAVDAHLKTPCGVMVDHSGNLLIADFGNNCIRKVSIDHTEVVRLPGLSAGINIYPNPNAGTFVVSGSRNSVAEHEVSVEISNLLGQVVYRNTVAAIKGKLVEQIELKNASSGVYFLQLTSENENSVIRFVITN